MSSTISFNWDFAKAPEVTLRLLQRNGGSMDRLKLVKMIFLADREHLVRYGRPIIGGQYYTMDKGPASSEFTEYTAGKRAEADIVFSVMGYNLIANRPVNERALSPSDREVLDEIYYKYKDYSPLQLVNITHEFKAYTKHIPPKGSRQEIPYDDFFEDTDDKSMLELITEEQEMRDL